MQLIFDKIGRDSKPTATYNSKLVLLDRVSPVSNDVKIGDSWECDVKFEQEKFIVVVPRKVVSTSVAIEAAPKKAIYEASPQQKAIYEALSNTNKNIFIQALAGTGKTSTLIGAMGVIPSNQSILYQAFNKSIVEEVREKIPSHIKNVSVSTCHAYAFRAYKSRFGKNVQIDGRKYYNIFKSISPSWGINFDMEEFQDAPEKILKLVDLARLYNIYDDDHQIYNLCQRYEIYLQDDFISRVSEIIKVGLDITDTIDYTDMLFMTLRKNISMIHFDYVLVDEAQDLNECQKQLALKSLKPGGRLITVGDSFQSIYGFSGATPDIFNELANLPNTAAFPLSVCYRCGSDIIKMAKTIVPEIEAHPSTGTGQVNPQARWEDIKDGDMVVCRITSPMVRLCMQYLSSGVKAYIVGRDVANGMISLIEKTKAKNYSALVPSLQTQLNRMLAKIIKTTGLNEKEAKETSTYCDLEDKISAILCVATPGDSVAEIIDRINNIFDDNTKDGIKMCTVHKSKGLEADHVHVLCPESMPMGKSTQPWIMQQEQNLIYVAYTRAKKTLSIVTNFERRGKSHKKTQNNA